MGGHTTVVVADGLQRRACDDGRSGIGSVSLLRSDGGEGLRSGCGVDAASGGGCGVGGRQWFPFTVKVVTVMSSSPHSTIVPSDSDTEDAFSSMNILNYFPASPGNISPNSSDDFTKYLLDILFFPPLHDNPYVQTYDAIPPPQVIMALPAIVPPQMFDSQDFYPPKNISSPKDTETPVESTTQVSLSSSMESSSPIRSTTSPPDYLFDEFIFAELDNSLWIISRPLGSEPILEEPEDRVGVRNIWFLILVGFFGSFVVVDAELAHGQVVNAVRFNQANAVKVSACWVWRPTKLDSALITLKKHNYIDARGRSKASHNRANQMNHALDRRLGHLYFKNSNKIVKDNLVRGLPTKHFENDQTCVACLKGKQHRASCKSKVLNPITKPLFMLLMDMFGPTFVSSLIHKNYCLVVTDDYSRFTWVFFLTTKDETNEILKNFIKEIENLVDKKVKIIRSDNGTEFKNKVMDDFCREKGIKREYSVARTPQQNGIAERRNRTLIEAARTMLADSKLPTTFWAEAVSTACYVQNRVLVVKPHNKTPYELF
ncbi:putative ribonuclease H-like domain-containing protein [Tanacetum coccineum]